MNDVFMGGLMMEILPLAEQIARAKLFPACSYFRVYKRGDALGRHTDRNACEVSLSICLGYEAARPWPIWIEGPQGVSTIELAPGDALVYRGIECPHWREPLEGDLAAQVFLHYVDQTGPYAQWKLDERTSLPVEEIMARRS
jgi:alkylated DNA repair dioxygenase AlkB